MKFITWIYVEQKTGIVEWQLLCENKQLIEQKTDCLLSMGKDTASMEL